MKTSGRDVVPQGLREGQLLVGWSGARGLIDAGDYETFRDIVHRAHYAGDPSYVRSGRAASQLWLFLKEMREDDLVVVPRGPDFHVGVVDGPPRYDDRGLRNDTAHRRPVRWLVDGLPIPRRLASDELVDRMRSRITITAASDVAAEIERAIDAAERRYRARAHP